MSLNKLLGKLFFTLMSALVWLWVEVTDLFNSIKKLFGLPTSEGESYATGKTPLASNMTTPRLMYLPHARNLSLFNGPDDFLKLTSIMERRSIERRLHLICGPRGVGKTELAIEFAYRHERDYSAIYWIEADTTEAIETSLIHAGREIDLDFKPEDGAMKAIRELYQWQETVGQDDCLLIFDNAPSLETILPYIPLHPRWQILVTSQQRDFGIDARDCIALSAWSADVATAFLLDRTGRTGKMLPSGDAGAMTTLIGELNGNPQAIQFAAWCMRHGSMRFGAYLQLFQAEARRTNFNRPSLHGSNSSEERITAVLQTTFELIRKEIQKLEPASLEVLAASALLAADPLPDYLLKMGASALGPACANIARNRSPFWLTAFSFNSALSTIGLIDVKGPEFMFTLHRSVRQFVRSTMSNPEKQRTLDAIISACELASPDPNWPVDQTMLIQHWRSLMLVPYTDGPMARRSARVLMNAAACLREYNHQTEATVYLEEAISIVRKKSMAKGPELGELLRALGETCLDVSLFDAAEAPLQESISLFRLHPSGDPYVLPINLNNLARVYLAQSKLTEAHALATEALTLWPPLAPKNDDSKIALLVNLAEISLALGEAELGEAQLSEALQIYRACSPRTNNPVAFRAFNLLAERNSERRDYANAAALTQELLEAEEAVFGGGSSRVSKTKDRLAATLAKLGRFDEAKKLWDEAIAVHRKLSPYYDRPLASILMAFATAQSNLHNYNEAETLLAEALAIHRRSGDAEWLIDIMSRLATICIHLERYEEAETLLNEAMEIDGASTNVDPHWRAGLFEAMSYLYKEQELWSIAEGYCRDALAIYREATPYPASSISNCLSALATLCNDQDRMEEAEELEREALSVLEGHVPSDHPNVAVGLGNLALFHHQNRRFDEAEALYKQAIEIDRKNGPGYVGSLAIDLTNYGNMLVSRTRYREAEKLLTEALEIRRATTPPGSVEIADALQSVAWVLQCDSRAMEAEPHLKESIRLMRRRLAPYDMQLVKAVRMLFDLYRENGRLEDATSVVREAVDAIRDAGDGPLDERCTALNYYAGGASHFPNQDETERIYLTGYALIRAKPKWDGSEIRYTLDRLIGHYRWQERYDEAIALTLYSIDRLRALNPIDFEEVQGHYCGLAESYKQQNRYPEAIAAYEEVFRIQEDEIPDGDWWIGDIEIGLTECYRAVGRFDLAEKVYRKCINEFRFGEPDSHYSLEEFIVFLAEHYCQESRYTEAEELYVEAIELAEEDADPDDESEYILELRNRLAEIRSFSA